MAKKYETVLVEKSEGITWLIMNRPDKRNAMSPQLHLDMDDALEDLATDPETEILILTGAGNEAFCAGQDIRLYFRGTEQDPKTRAKARRASNQWRWQRLSTFPRPTIAMVNGFCFGGGFTQESACDFAIAADEAQFGLSEVNWGILPGGIVSWNVVQMMNFRDAMYYAMTGDTFDGKRAVEIGLVNFAVPKAKLKEETVKLAEKLLKLNAGVVRHTKEAIRAVRKMDDKQARDYLKSKQDSLKGADKEIREQHGMKQFLDEKSYRPGLGPFRKVEGA